MGNNKFFKTGQGGVPAVGLSIVQTNTQSAIGGTLTHSLTGVPAGALIVITTGSNQAQTDATVGSTPSLTFTKRVDATTPLSPGAEIYTAVFTAGGSLSITVSWGSAYQSSVAYVITGQETTLGGGQATGLNQGTSNVNITTSKTNSLVFAVASNWNAPTLPLTYRGTPIQSLGARDAANGTFAHYYYPFAVVSTYVTGYSAPNDVDNGTSSAVYEVRSNAGGGGGNTAPSSPILSSTNSGTSFVDLAWTAATDDVAVTGYQIYRNGVLQTTVTGLTNTQSGLNNSTTYSFYVRAIDGAGLGTDSNTISVTTLPGATTTTTTTTSVGPTTTTTTTTTIPPNPFTFTAQNGDYRRYWGGQEFWGGGDLAITTVDENGNAFGPAHRYRRFVWNDWESSPAGSYIFTGAGSNNLKTFLDACIAQKQLASFGVMTCYPGFDSGNSFHTRTSFNGIGAAYPTYLHNLMQSEAQPDWENGDCWTPNWNSSYYIGRFTALMVALNTFLNTNHSSGIKYGDTVGYIDLRGMGAYGEWHSYGIVTDSPVADIFQYPGFAWTTSGGQKIITSYGAMASPASLIQIIDAQRNNLPDWPLTTILNSLDGNFPNGGTGQYSGYYGTGFINTGIPVSVGQYIMNNGNAWGDIGRRRDQWGDSNNYYSRISEETNAITGTTTRWQTAPINGEPPGYPVPSPCNSSTMMQAFPAQAVTQHATVVGNSNYGGCSPNVTTMRTAFRSMGCVLRLVTGGGITFTATQMHITLLWRNFGVAPQYKKDWQVTFELRSSGGGLVWSEVSSLNLFSNSGLKNDNGSNTSIVDTFTKPALSPATYQLSVIIKDPNNYLEPLQLGIRGRQTSGAYILSNVTF